MRDFARENVFDVLGMKHTDYLPCLRDKNGKWINTVPLPENIAPTEKQPDGQVLCGQVHDPLARILNGGISGNAGVLMEKSIQLSEEKKQQIYASIYDDGTDIAFSARKA